MVSGPAPEGGGGAVAWCGGPWRWGWDGQSVGCWWLLVCFEVEVRVLKVAGRRVTGEDCCLSGTKYKAGEAAAGMYKDGPLEASPPCVSHLMGATPRCRALEWAGFAKGGGDEDGYRGLQELGHGVQAWVWLTAISQVPQCSRYWPEPPDSQWRGNTVANLMCCYLSFTGEVVGGGDASADGKSWGAEPE